MKYLSIDIETSGLDHEKNDILSVAAIIEDTEKVLPWEEIPKFHVAILRHEITGSPRAITMNSKLIEYISRWMEPENELDSMNISNESGLTFCREEDLAKEFYWFLEENGLGHGLDNSGGYSEFKGGLKQGSAMNNATKPITINVAGKNFATFDKKFLEKLPWWQKLIRIRQRVLDPAILFVDWKEDESLPSLDKCKNRAGIHGLVTHNALEDAWDVIELLRKRY
jgi:oligoribonuclease